ncbi:unnamed protein product [Symbiodinium natans]|uniref:Uncharacterized protein n=1 Tax=Symbiodinium natans TaxID=878477 RepID=A0A812TYZ4_9DINO|nr:unnamed protein product [Symbiodinium natans]
MGLTPLAAGPVQRILAPSPIVRTISTGSEVSLGRTLSTSRPYPPGLGYTPISTPKDSLSRASSFGINGEVESCKPRRKSMDLTAVLEAHAEDHIFSREFLLLFRGSPEGEDAAEVGFVLPAPGFFRTQAAGPEAAPQTQSEAPRPAKVATTKAKPAQAAQGKGKGWSEPGKGAAETSQAPVAAQKGSPAAQKGSPPSHGYKGQQAQQHQYYPMKGQNWAGKGAWTWGPKGGWYMWPGQKGGWY